MGLVEPSTKIKTRRRNYQGVNRNTISYNDLSDGALVAWLTDFVTVATANAATLGIDLADQTEIDNARRL